MQISTQRETILGHGQFIYFCFGSLNVPFISICRNSVGTSAEYSNEILFYGAFVRIMTRHFGSVENIETFRWSGKISGKRVYRKIPTRKYVIKDGI